MKFEVNETVGTIWVIPEPGDPFKSASSVYPGTKTVNGVEVVDFGENKKTNGERINLLIKLEGRPELVAALERARVIRDEKDAADKAEQEKRAAERSAYIDACPPKHEPCTRNWANGDLMSAEYVAPDGTTILDSDLLEGKYGIYYIESDKLDRQRAARKAQADRKAAEKKAAEAERSAKFEEARKTGKPVVLRSWCETRRDHEGGEWGDYTFACQELAMPDGTTQTTATNTY